MSYHGTTLVNPGFGQDDPEDRFEDEQESHCCDQPEEGITYSHDHKCKGFEKKRFTVSVLSTQGDYQGQSYTSTAFSVKMGLDCRCVCDQGVIHGGNEYDPTDYSITTPGFRDSIDGEFVITRPIEDCNCDSEMEYQIGNQTQATKEGAKCLVTDIRHPTVIDATKWDSGKTRHWYWVDGSVDFIVTQNTNTGEVYKGDDPSTPPAVIDTNQQGVRIRIPIRPENDDGPPVTSPPYPPGSDEGGSSGWGALGDEDAAMTRLRDCFVGNITDSRPITDGMLEGSVSHRIARNCDSNCFDWLASLFPDTKCEVTNE